ncbi:ARMT1-like domain-containing protein [Actinotalea sp. M2MS4P-6]|uniref:damage-control phosphatase ARMT1 family protein n=1 Tax=Actinotalea sp. M2MS4P-6 TaxID=2983762 RepID=UPI0021E4A8ED|nr:ARMT1-like domain-containing protein [Actinotalea sp. M2MS4P-6]MCV2393623.1 ARMT1-like domain-containing protein [Actinotalea sp. M2MS4P-6]
MQTYLDCYPCFVRQALAAARFAGADAATQRSVVRATLELLEDVPADAAPPRIADDVHRCVRAEIGDGDPYADLKAQSTRAALDLYPWLTTLVAEAADPVETAVRVAIAGNIIDVGPSDTIADLRATVERVLAAPLVGDLTELRTELARAPWVLYVADNAGETVFDRVLVETLRVPVDYAVKGGPTLNDATRADAEAAGLARVARVIDTGYDAPGVDLERSSADFRRSFASAPLVLAKGQANYESLSEAGDRVFCLLQVKCPVIGRDLGVEVGSVVVRRATDPVPATETLVPVG